MTQLEIIDLRKTYDNKIWALDGVSFEVKQGDFIILLGLSGSGKSTLLRCINRLIEPNSGNVRFEGKSILGLPPPSSAATAAISEWFFNSLTW